MSEIGQQVVLFINVGQLDFITEKVGHTLSINHSVYFNSLFILRKLDELKLLHNFYCFFNEKLSIVQFFINVF